MPATTPLHLLLISPFYGVHGGGVEKVAQALAERLVATGRFTITWAASDVDDPRAGPLPQAMMALPMRTVDVLERKTGIPMPVWTPGSLRRLATAMDQADVVHLHECVYPSHVAVMWMARRRRKPVLLTQHIGDGTYNAALPRLAHRLANRTLGVWTLRRADRVAFISHTARDVFARRLRPNQRWDVVPNGVDTDVFVPRHDSRDPTAPPLLLFVGRFVTKKGLTIIRELARRQPAWRWQLAGAGPVNPDDWGLANVEVIRGRRGPTLTPLYQAADLLVLPSFGEGFPLVVQEAMACGCPVAVTCEVAHALPGVAERVWHAPVNPTPGRLDDTVRTWEALLTDALVDRPRLIARGRDAAGWARAQWSWDRCVQWYMDALQDLCSRDWPQDTTASH